MLLETPCSHPLFLPGGNLQMVTTLCRGTPLQESAYVNKRRRASRHRPRLSTFETLNGMDTLAQLAEVQPSADTASFGCWTLPAPWCLCKAHDPKTPKTYHWLRANKNGPL